mmetsp:Transcript_32751/g.61503  ORF Transcript_32751/g.61503 Transcript_32751/m.61503 type:complete len:93 (+) Transcript_32751:201-479(+)
MLALRDGVKGAPPFLVFCLLVASLGATTAEALSPSAGGWGGPSGIFGTPLSECCAPSCASPISLLTIAGVGFLAGGALTLSDPLASVLLTAL